MTFFLLYILGLSLESFQSIPPHKLTEFSLLSQMNMLTSKYVLLFLASILNLFLFSGLREDGERILTYLMKLASGEVAYNR